MEMLRNIISSCIAETKAEEAREWYVLRDLRRANAKVRACQVLRETGLEVFTPMKWVQETVAGKRIRVERPVIPDLLIVHATLTELAPFVTFANRLQFRFVRGGREKKMVVNETEMERFMRAASEASSIEYYSPEDFNPDQIGTTIRIKGGPLDGEEAVLLNVNGKRKRQIIVRLSNLFVAVIELKQHEAEPQ